MAYLLHFLDDLRMSPNAYAAPAVLGLVQGLGEFLPISSSAHLILVRRVPGLEAAHLESLAYDVALHAGTTVALLASTGRDWVRLCQAAAHPSDAEGRLFWLVAVASVPGALAGYLLDERASTTFRAPARVAGTLAAVGVLLYLADRFRSEERTLADIGGRDAIALGLAQAAALVPGVSRSGATLAMGRLLGFGREPAARFSFLMALPITLGALVFKSKDIDLADVDGPFVLGIVVAAGTGALAMRLLLRYLARPSSSLLPFAIYRCVVAALIVALRRTRRRS